MAGVTYRGFDSRTSLTRWGLAAVAIGIVAGATLPGAVAGVAAVVDGNRASLPWLFERLFAFLAYLAITGSVVYGLLLSTKVLDHLAHRPVSFLLHKDLAAIGVGLAAIHGMLLGLDHTVPFSMPQILVPGLAPHATVARRVRPGRPLPRAHRDRQLLRPAPDRPSGLAGAPLPDLPRLPRRDRSRHRRGDATAARGGRRACTSPRRRRSRSCSPIGSPCRPDSAARGRGGRGSRVAVASRTAVRSDSRQADHDDAGHGAATRHRIAVTDEVDRLGHVADDGRPDAARAASSSPTGAARRCDPSRRARTPGRWPAAASQRRCPTGRPGTRLATGRVRAAHGTPDRVAQRGRAAARARRCSERRRGVAAPRRPTRPRVLVLDQERRLRRPELPRRGRPPAHDAAVAAASATPSHRRPRSTTRPPGGAPTSPVDVVGREGERRPEALARPRRARPSVARADRGPRRRRRERPIEHADELEVRVAEEREAVERAPRLVPARRR